MWRIRSPAWCWHRGAFMHLTAWLYPVPMPGLYSPNPNHSPLRKWRRITSICATHAPLTENKALFVLYHSFTLSTLALRSVFSLCYYSSFVLSFFLCHSARLWNSVLPQLRDRKWVMDREIKRVAWGKWTWGRKKTEADRISKWQCFVFLDLCINCCCCWCVLFMNE